MSLLKTSSGSPNAKLTVQLIPKSVVALEEEARESGDSITDVVNRASLRGYRATNPLRTSHLD